MRSSGVLLDSSAFTSVTTTIFIYRFYMFLQSHPTERSRNLCFPVKIDPTPSYHQPTNPKPQGPQGLSALIPQRSSMTMSIWSISKYGGCLTKWTVTQRTQTRENMHKYIVSNPPETRWAMCKQMSCSELIEIQHTNIRQPFSTWYCNNFKPMAGCPCWYRACRTLCTQSLWKGTCLDDSSSSLPLSLRQLRAKSRTEKPLELQGKEKRWDAASSRESSVCLCRFAQLNCVQRTPLALRSKGYPHLLRRRIHHQGSSP